MGTNARAALSPEMLLFEIAAMCSRHGLPVPPLANPAAAVAAAERLMHMLGLVSHEPIALPAAPAPDLNIPIKLPRQPDGPPPIRWMPAPSGTDVTMSLPLVPAPGTPRPLFGSRGAHRASRPLAAVPPNGGA